MKLQDFNYTLPPELIAQHPCAKRDQSRLMIVDRATQTIRHDIFRNLAVYLPPKSVLVVNNSKVIPARLLGKKEKTGGEVEIFLLKKIDEFCYEALLRPLKKIRVDEPMVFAGGVKAVLVDKDNRIVRFNKKNIEKHLNKIGHMPLPPYISRQDTALDKKEYQTVYAKTAGSVASPTAGLHFTKKLLTELKAKGHGVCPLTLHINYGTFKPVEVEDITQHPMHWEDYVLTPKAWVQINKARAQGRKITAVGTTSCRVLESVVKSGKFSGSTNIFIYPGFSFRMIDCLITNFHLPFSTLLMLVYAFGGMDLMKRAYAEAIKEKYRFYSYGDGMLIL
jgi:S-adenosylmethionine:tRNA ribosyltransferase-isomerase